MASPRSILNFNVSSTTHSMGELGVRSEELGVVEQKSPSGIFDE